MTPPYKYLRLNHEGRLLARIPRFGRLMARLPDDQFDGLTSAAAVYWKLYTFGTTEMDADTGLFDSGLRTKAGKKIGVPEDSSPDLDDTAYRKWQIECCCAIISAIAFKMYVRDKRPQDFAEDGDSVKTEAVSLLAQTGPKTTCLGEKISRSDWHRWLAALLKTDAHHLQYITFSATSNLKWTDISTQAFFAAMWVCRWGSPNCLKKTRRWIPYAIKRKLANPNRWQGEFEVVDTNAEYYEFWKMVIDLPVAAVDRRRREKLLSPLYDGSIKDKKEKRPIRSTELICQAWDLMHGTSVQQKFLQEFQSIVMDTADPRSITANELLRDLDGKYGPNDASHFLTLCELRGGELDNGRFTMGAPPDEEPDWDQRIKGLNAQDNPQHPVRLEPFRMHRICVTNAQYELFDPRHADFRAFSDKVEDPSELARHPVVNVSWWDAVAFARFLGEVEIELGAEKRQYEIRLPTEAQWEYACRCGQTTPFTWGLDSNGSQRDGNKIESGYCNFDGNHAWSRSGTAYANNGPNLERTILVDGGVESKVVVSANPWGFWQMHGNAWEWCRDWYDPEFYHSSVDEVENPEKSVDEVENPENASVATNRVLRGGSWFFYGRCCRSACRGGYLPGGRSTSSSFRLAAVPVKPSQIK